jgi:hypothetical protein
MTERAWPEVWAGRVAGQGCPMCGAIGQGDRRRRDSRALTRRYGRPLKCVLLNCGTQIWSSWRAAILRWALEVQLIGP